MDQYHTTDGTPSNMRAFLGFGPRDQEKRKRQHMALKGSTARSDLSIERIKEYKFFISFNMLTKPQLHQDTDFPMNYNRMLIIRIVQI